jgi:hypothetical protein
MPLKNFQIKNFQRGSAIYFAVLILIILLAMGLALNAILIRQIKTVKKIEDSIIAFYASDTGWEKEMYLRREPATTSKGYLDLNNNNQPDENDAFYEVNVIAEGQEDCFDDSNQNTNLCVISTGTFKNVQRRIFMRR